MRRRFCHALAILIIAAIPLSAAANHIGNIQFEFPSNSYLAFGTRAHVNFDYNVTNPDGARILVQPISGTSTTPNYSYSGSILLPVGSGSDDNWITILSGDAVVDHYRLAMYNSDWSELLMEIILPMTYHYSENGAFNIRPDHTQPSWLGAGERLSFTVDTEVADPAGALLFIRPFTNGALTPGYGASGGSVLSGSGTATQSFTFFNPPADIDAIRVRMTSTDKSMTYLEFFMPMEYHWRDHGLSNFVLSPPPPAWLPTGTTIGVQCDYVRNDPGEYIQIFAVGYFEGVFVEPQNYSNSGHLLAASGSATMGSTYMGTDEVSYDSFALTMRNDAYDHIMEESLPVEYHFGPNAIYNISVTPAAPAVLSHDEHVNVSFDYTTNESGGCRIFTKPMTDGEASPARAYSASPLYPVGSGHGSSFFQILAGNVQVDQILFLMENSNSTETIFQFTLDTCHIYGEDGYVTSVPGITPAARPALNPNYPNPFNPSTSIVFTMPEADNARVGIFDLKGRLVLDLFSGLANQGENRLVWNGRDNQGSAVPSGTYFYRLATAAGTQTRKMILIK